MFLQFLCPSSGVFHRTHSNGTRHTVLRIACKLLSKLSKLRPYALGGLYGQMLIITTEYFVYILPPSPTILHQNWSQNLYIFVGLNSGFLMKENLQYLFQVVSALSPSIGGVLREVVVNGRCSLCGFGGSTYTKRWMISCILYSVLLSLYMWTHMHAF
jgi:hypothetical protein